MKNIGFTLIETIITLMIMAVLTLMSARTIQQSFRAKAKIQDQIDQVGQVKDTLRMLERDLNLAFHAQDLQKDLADEFEKVKKKNPTQPTPQKPSGESGNPEQPTPTATPNKFGELLNQSIKSPNRISPVTQFVGKEEELHFVTSNTVRLVKDSPQADFGEVSYYVDICKNRADKQFEAGKCLFRRFSPVVDKDVTKGGHFTQLVPDVTEFKLKYYSKVQKDWRTDWDSKEEGGDLNTKSRYPEAVEVNLTVEPPIKDPKTKKKKKISLQMIIPIHFPNNKEADEKSNPNTPTPPE